MDDGSSNNSKKVNQKGLIKEWNLLWASLIEDAEGVPLTTVEDLTLEELSHKERGELVSLKKALSEKRKRLNQKLESIQKETDLNIAKLESLKLVGGDIESTENKINELSDLGQKISDDLEKIDEKIKILRGIELEKNKEA